MTEEPSEYRLGLPEDDAGPATQGVVGWARGVGVKAMEEEAMAMAKKGPQAQVLTEAATGRRHRGYRMRCPTSRADTLHSRKC